MELSTERQTGFSAGMIPVSRVWAYLDRFGLPDWWEPVLVKIDAELVARVNREKKRSAAKHNQRSQHG